MTLHNETLNNEAAVKNYSIKIGGKSKFQLEQALTAPPFSMADSAREMMRSPSFVTQGDEQYIPVVRGTLSDLGFTENYVTVAQIFRQAPKLGLGLLPAEVGPYARLQDKNQDTRDPQYYIAMNPIADRTGTPSVFGAVHRNDAMFLTGVWVRPEDRWFLDTIWVFGFKLGRSQA